MLASDTFTRANQAGFGVASDGHTWDSDGNESVIANHGVILSPATSSSFLGLGTPTGQDMEGVVRFSIGATNDTAGILLRLGSTGNYWLARYDGVGNVQLLVSVNGTHAPGVNAPFAPTPGALYWMRFRVQGSNTMAKVWADGTAEPANWTVSAVSNVAATTARMGLYGYGHTATGGTHFDSFAVSSV